jgi:hypothetical protein
MKIYAPVDNVNGVYASVLFVNSVGETKNPALIHWFKTHGYRIEDDSPVKTAEEHLNLVCDTLMPKTNETTELDFESMTPLELRDWMKENGFGNKIKNIRNKDKLLEIIRG